MHDLETKLKAYQNWTYLSKEIIDSQLIQKNIAISLDYCSIESFKRKKKKEIGTVFVYTGTEQAPEGKNIPHIPKNSKRPLNKEAVPQTLNEHDLLIKEELRNEEVFGPQIKEGPTVVPTSLFVKEASDDSGWGST